MRKLGIKSACIGIGASKDGSRPHYNWHLFRSVFPELNRQMPLHFLKARTKRSLVMLLAAWHLEWLAEAIFWAKAKMRELKAGRN